MLVTLIPVTYRDTNGVELHGEIRLDGALTDHHRKAFKAALAGGRDFVPGQLGLSVMSREVGQSGDRWLSSDGGVGSVVIVEVQPAR